ncbi:uncharacterized protein N7459_005024 [Penicillium hispanicum]|uniref:uncharacterized protein n=1 Tax=Penicillium hispanicum TaxID=1080232 RepID=UPI0025416D24|nr:uncharacterized protein N7459_005024 [Penicillium hispanicum]KAJ5585224.1 hypothetical protein N7459_005024 [Penicillium hispanicum]
MTRPDRDADLHRCKNPREHHQHHGIPHLATKDKNETRQRLAIAHHVLDRRRFAQTPPHRRHRNDSTLDSPFARQTPQMTSSPPHAVGPNQDFGGQGGSSASVEADDREHVWRDAFHDINRLDSDLTRDGFEEVAVAEWGYTAWRRCRRRYLKRLCCACWRADPAAAIRRLPSCSTWPLQGHSPCELALAPSYETILQTGVSPTVAPPAT